MFVCRMVADKWSGVLCVDEEIYSPTIKDLECFVDALDASVRTLVSLYGPDDSSLSIGGGSGRYIVFFSATDGSFWNLVADSDWGDELIRLNVGGQEGEFVAKQVVGKDEMLRAARTFFCTGRLDPRALWEKQA